MVDISDFTAANILDKRLSPVWSRIRMRARAVVGCRLGGKNAGGTHSRPELREWTRTSRPSGDVEGQKEEASTNVSVLSGQLSVTVPPLYWLSIGSRLSI
jgi:hypothetical protein